MTGRSFFAVAPGARGFVDGAGKPFIPRGFNYDRSYSRCADVLLEEIVERAPAKLDQGFAKAREYGANAVHLFLQRVLDFQTFREEHAVRWTRELVTAIRRHDRRHLVTIGLLPGSVPVESGSPRGYTGFAPHLLAPWLDFMSMHLHPQRVADRERYVAENLAVHELILLGCQVGQPVVVEEWFALGDGVARGYVTPGEWFDAFIELTGLKG